PRLRRLRVCAVACKPWPRRLLAERDASIVLQPMRAGRANMASPAAGMVALAVSLLPAAAAAAPPSGYVGAAACRPCHETAWQKWSASHHAKAMAEPSAATVLGDFRGTRFEKDGVVTTFRRDGDAYVVTTQGADSETHDYRVRDVFGVYPLQQLLLET